jgi:hypothetical protein
MVGSTVGRFAIAQRWAAGRHGVTARAGRRRCLFELGEEERASPRLGSMGRTCRLGQIPWKELLRILNWNLDFSKVLEICTRRFMRNFNVGIFSKLS